MARKRGTFKETINAMAPAYKFEEYVLLGPDVSWTAKANGALLKNIRGGCSGNP